jgi:hypothetical protein
MKKGIVIPKKLSHKNGVSKLSAGDSVTENDVNNFDELVKNGCIQLKDEPKKPSKKKAEKSE